MKLIGAIDEVVFRNNENGYSVIKLSPIGSLENITVSGKFPIVGEGEILELEGEYVNHPKFGMQFQTLSCKINQPTTKEQLVKYLSSGLILGVGPVTATAIVEKFGENALKVIEEKGATELAKVRGISIKKATDIVRTIQDIKRMQDAVIFLQKYDISINLAVKIYNEYKGATETILSKNPYKLIEDIDGVGFKTADKIANKMGIESDSEFRMRAGIIHCLIELAEKNGSTVTSQDTLIEKTCMLLEMDKNAKREAFEKVLVGLYIDGICNEYVEETTLVALTRYSTLEKSIATNIKRLQMSVDMVAVDTDADIKEFEMINKIQLHDTQKRAIKSAVNDGMAVITGGPGTGKTTIIKAIIKILKSRNQRCILCAPTGRASKRLSESTGEEAGTIHRVLESSYGGNGRSFLHNAQNPLEADVVIVDEASMIDVYVMSSLLRAIPSGARFIIVGDKDQLPSVGAGNVLADIIASGIMPVVSLTRIYRQADESLIIENAHLINEKKMPILDKKEGDFFHIRKIGQQDIACEIVSLAKLRLPKYQKCDWTSIQILAPMKSGQCGVDNLNKLLQSELNPQKGQAEVEFGGRLFRVGDRVMQTSNNYDQEWTKFNGNYTTEGTGVFNGDIGYVQDVNAKTSEVVVEFEDGRRTSYSIAEIGDLSLAYAITIHKSQGSEFDVIIIPVCGGNPVLLNKNLLYTAVTRAKKLVVLVGQKEHIAFMVKNERMEQRQTLLPKFLGEIYE